MARLGGIRKAAQFLEIDTAVVSRHLRALEAWTQTLLLERGNTGTSLTEAGLAYHRRVAVAIDELAMATVNLMQRQQIERLQIWCAPGFASGWLVPRLSRFNALAHGWALDLRPADRPPDFSRQEADVDIRYVAVYDPLPILQPGVLSLELASPAVIPVASPAYLAGRPPIKNVSDLLNLELLHEESFANWRAWFSHHDHADHDLIIDGPKFWHANMTVEAARAGAGVALANIFLAGDDIAAGRLVEVGRGHLTGVSLGAYMLYARADRWQSETVAEFYRWMVAEVDRTRSDAQPVSV